MVEIGRPHDARPRSHYRCQSTVLADRLHPCRDPYPAAHRCALSTRARAPGPTVTFTLLVAEGEHAKPPRATAVTKAEFLKACDDYGRAVFSRILDLADRKGMGVRWGTSGFSMGVDVDGTRVVICYVYPPGTLYTALHDRAGIQKKTAAPVEAVEQLRKEAEQTGLFQPAGARKLMNRLRFIQKEPQRWNKSYRR